MSTLKTKRAPAATAVPNSHKPKRQPNTTITITVPQDIAQYFATIIRMNAHHRDVNSALLAHMRDEIKNHFRNIESEEDPNSWRLSQSLSGFFSNLDRKTYANICGYDRWPYVDEGRPKNYEDAVAEARRRGREAYRKELDKQL